MNQPLFFQGRGARSCASAGIAALLFAGSVPAEVPPRSASGLTLQVPEEQLGDGQAYYLLEGDTQISLSSRAELQAVTLSTGRAVGYIVGPFVEDSEDGSVDKPALAGALRIPSASLRSGSASSDRMLHGAGFLDVANHPEIGVELRGVSGVEALPVGNEQLGQLIRARAKLGVAIDFKGEEHLLDVPAELSYRLSSNAAMSRMVGDLATLEAEFEMELGQLGVSVPPPLAALLAPRARVSLFLVFSNVDPERTLDPSLTQAQHVAESRISTLLTDLRQTAEAYSLADSYALEHWDDPVTLNRLAFNLVTVEGAERRDFALAGKIAGRANELRAGKDGHVLNTLARIQFETGELERAVELQRTAVANLDGVPARIAAAIRGNLQRFEAALAAK